jgi:predicted AAA+ superfamily ATPase
MLDFHGYTLVMIDRKTDLGLIRTALKRSRIVALVGPRQSGKTTLARQFVSAKSLNYFDLECSGTGSRTGCQRIYRAPLPRSDDRRVHGTTTAAMVRKPEQTSGQGAELDLLLFKRGRRIGIECKRADAPVLTPSMRIAINDLKLDELTVVYPGKKRYMLAKKIEVVPLSEFVNI